MLSDLQQLPADPLLALIEMHRADPRPFKIDLGVGVYRNAAGETPVMRAVKLAEARILEQQTTKAYVGASGDTTFLRLVADGLFARDSIRRAVGIQTPGGTGALRIASDLLVRAGVSSIWVSQPTWANHEAVFSGANLTVRRHAYVEAGQQVVDFDRMLDSLKVAAKGDALLLQASCHNPTGIDLSIDQWRVIADLVAERGLIPLIDVAYQGLGRTPEEDIAGAHAVLAAASEALVAVSMSKTFGLYRERTGAAFALADFA